MTTRVWYNAKIKDGKLWSDWPPGTKVLISHNHESHAAGHTFWLFDNKRLRLVVSELARSTFKVSTKYRDQEECEAHVRPFLADHTRIRIGLPPRIDPNAAKVGKIGKKMTKK